MIIQKDNIQTSVFMWKTKFQLYLPLSSFSLSLSPLSLSLSPFPLPLSSLSPSLLFLSLSFSLSLQFAWLSLHYFQLWAVKTLWIVLDSKPGLLTSVTLEIVSQTEELFFSALQWRNRERRKKSHPIFLFYFIPNVKKKCYPDFRRSLSLWYCDNQ